MTINEIENTLQTLEARHPDLTEGMLVTLLTASGWEVKPIQEAVVLFKESRTKKVTQSVPLPPNIKTEQAPPIAGAVPVSGPSLPAQTVMPTSDIVYFDSTGAEERELTAFAESNKEIPIIDDKIKFDKVNYDDVKHDKVFTTSQPLPSTVIQSEPQSLISPVVEEKKSQIAEPPENLPLRPFESNDHVWPLSRYKDVFHGETAPQPQQPVVSPPPEETVTTPPIPVVKESNEEHKHHKKIEFKRTGFDGEDEGLIFLTGTSLIIIILLLVYMYSNGRM